MKTNWIKYVVGVFFAQILCAQFGPPPPPPPKPGKAGATADLTGYWVSPVMEDYRWRMITPLKGDAASVPFKASARATIDAWDPAKDEAAGQQCKAYGAPAIMRVPGRLHITWQDDLTLKIETDAGTQTRLFHFAAQGSPVVSAPANSAPSLQGFSVANWEGSQRSTASGIAVGVSARFGGRSRSMEVTTTNLREGYLRKNGLPYSDKTVVTEYYDRFDEPNGDQWFTVTTIVVDPAYLSEPFVTTTDFKKEADGAKYSPSACSAR